MSKSGNNNNNEDNYDRCVCVPYDDAYMITAMVLSIVALLLSWVWWAGFTIGLTATLLLQLAWCVRKTEPAIILIVFACAMASLADIFAGAYLLVHRDDGDGGDNDNAGCRPFSLHHRCPGNVWAGISFLGAGFYLGAACFAILFLSSGRYHKLEAQLTSGTRDDNDDGDIGAVDAEAVVIESTDGP